MKELSFIAISLPFILLQAIFQKGYKMLTIFVKLFILDVFGHYTKNEVFH